MSSREARLAKFLVDARKPRSPALATHTRVDIHAGKGADIFAGLRHVLQCAGGSMSAQLRFARWWMAAGAMVRVNGKRIGKRELEGMILYQRCREHSTAKPRIALRVHGHAREGQPA